MFTGLFAPDANEDQIHAFNDMQRVSCSADNAVKFQEAFGEIDVEDIVGQVRAPTLILHASRDQRIALDNGRRIAAAIPGGRFVMLDSRNHILLEHEPAWATLLREVREFIGADPMPAVPAAEPTGDGASLFQKLKERKIVQWAVPYLAGAWIIVQVLDVLEGPWHLSELTIRAAQLLLATGFPIILALAWYLGGRAAPRA